MTVYFKDGRWQMMIKPPDQSRDERRDEKRKKSSRVELPETIALRKRMALENGVEDETVKEIWE